MEEDLRRIGLNENQITELTDVFENNPDKALAKLPEIISNDFYLGAVVRYIFTEQHDN